MSYCSTHVRFDFVHKLMPWKPNSPVCCPSVEFQHKLFQIHRFQEPYPQSRSSQNSPYHQLKQEKENFKNIFKVKLH